MYDIKLPSSYQQMSMVSVLHVMYNYYVFNYSSSNMPRASVHLMTLINARCSRHHTGVKTLTICSWAASDSICYIVYFYYRFQHVTSVTFSVVEVEWGSFNAQPKNSGWTERGDILQC